MSSGARHRHRRIDYPQRRLMGTIAVAAIVWAAVGGLLTLALAIYPVRSGAFPLVPRLPYTRTYDPIFLVERGLSPDIPIDATALDAAPRDPGVRLIAVRPDEMTLLVGGVPVRSVPRPPEITDIAALCDLIADPDWIQRSGPRGILLKSALVVYPGVDLTVGGGDINDLALLNRTGVLLGVNGGGLRFQGVRVHVDPAAATLPGRYRPFLLAIGKGVMRFHYSDIDGLGWDSNGGYGVSWQDGSTGEAVNTTFENNFIGVYTAQATGLLFRRCTFRKNHMYGLDPHTYSRNIVVDDSLAEDNGAHGFIFSEYVRDSVIMNSTSRGNGENGIMMDAHSTQNLIYNNDVIDNNGDGIVTADSPRNSFRSNIIEGNRVGVKTSPADARSTEFEDNRVLFNKLASEHMPIADGPERNTVVGNGGQWNLDALRSVWMGIAVALCLSVALLSGYSRRWHEKVPA